MKSFRDLISLMESYQVVPGIDRERYQERDGLEGPFRAQNGKVVYYDPKEGRYYDPDTDIYMDSDFQLNETDADGGLGEYTSRLNALLAKKGEQQKSGMKFPEIEREYSVGYRQLLNDLPDAHRAYVKAQNDKMWAGNDWQRDDKSGRSAVDETDVVEGHWWKDPDDDPEEMPEYLMTEYIDQVRWYMEKGLNIDQALAKFEKYLIDDHDYDNRGARSIRYDVEKELNRQELAADQQTNEADMNEDREYDLNFITQSIRSNYDIAASEEELKKMVAGETGYGSNPDFDNMFHSSLDHFLNGDDSMFDDSMFDDSVDGDHDSAMASAGFGSDEDYGDFPMEDINNGYRDVKKIDGCDFFPNGADGPVVKSIGPSGARHGDNPEQKKMQVDETHTELVYAYRNFLKESAAKK